jgi:hypothetical protein
VTARQHFFNDGYSPEHQRDHGIRGEDATARLCAHFGYEHTLHPFGTLDIDHKISKNGVTFYADSEVRPQWPLNKDVFPWSPLHIPHRKTDKLYGRGRSVYIAWRKDFHVAVLIDMQEAKDAGAKTTKGPPNYRIPQGGEAFLNIPNACCRYWYTGGALQFAPDPFEWMLEPYHPACPKQRYPSQARQRQSIHQPCLFLEDAQ